MPILVDKAEKASKLYKEQDALRTEAAFAKSCIERDESMIDLYTDDKWSAFMQKILQPEMDRLARLRMSVNVDDHDVHVAITGQYKEAELLARGRDRLQEDVDENTRLLYKLQGKQLDVQNKLNKLKE